MTDAPVPSVRDRLLAALISPARIDDHYAAGRLSVDGETVTDLDQPAPIPARIVIRGDQ